MTYKTPRFHVVTSTFLGLLLLIGSSIANEHKNRNQDWPQWRGPNRDGISYEMELLKEWPSEGPIELWRIPIGEGFSGISVSNGKVYTMVAEGSNESVICLDAANGNEIWRFRTDGFYGESQGGNGPRSTPTIDGDILYTVSAFGKLYALNANTGDQLWRRDFQREFGSEMPRWGYCMSPLVEGDLLLVEVGGKDDKSIIAFDKENGESVWTAQRDVPGYSSPITIDVHGVRQTIFFTGTKLMSVSPEDGRLYWDYRWSTSYDANAATPVFIPPDKVFISSGYGTGAAVVQIKTVISPQDKADIVEQIGNNRNKIKVDQLWKNKGMKNHFASSVLYNDYLYGFDNSILKCIEADTGQERWKTRGFGKGSLMLADDHLIVLGDKGELALAEATPAEFNEIAKAKVLEGLCWTAPTLSGGKLYLRNEREMVCLDVTGQSVKISNP